MSESIPNQEQNEELFNDFLQNNGHTISEQTWIENHNKKQCPECFSLHELSAEKCSVCNWKVN